MKDILGREVKAGDLVIGMVISRDSDGMRHGVFNGESVHWMKWGITTSVLTNMYIVANPTEQELAIKQKILDAVKERDDAKEAEKLRRKMTTRIPAKDLVIGKTYVDEKGDHMIYLGKGKVVSVDNYGHKTDKEGYIYISCYSDGYDAFANIWTWIPTIDVLKNPRKLVALSDKVLTKYDFTTKKEFKLRGKEYSSNYYGYRRQTPYADITLV